MALSAEIQRAVRRYGRTVDPLARERYGISGEGLLAKLIQGESGGRANAVSPVGARGLAQFMPATRQAVLAKYGIDPWRSADEAVHAASLHLRGKLGHKTGLEGYNPGDPKYANYILRQKVGDVSAGGSRTPSATAGGMRMLAAQTDTRGSLMAAMRALEQAREERQTQTVPAMPVPAPAFSASVRLPEGYAPIQTAAPQQREDEGGALQEALNALRTLRRQSGGAQIETAPTSIGGNAGGGRAAIQTGGRWEGTQRVAQTARRIGNEFGLTVHSAKRDRRGTATGGISDHWIGARNSYAYDLADGSDVETNNKLRAAREIAAAYGVPFRKDSYESGGTIRVGGQRYRVQILYGSGVDHANHVHVGVKRIR